MVLSIDSATVISFAGPSTIVDETGSGTSFKVADKIQIGTTKKSFSLEKAFLDLTTKALIYKGMIVSSMSISATYGEVVTGTFTFSGNSYQEVDSSAEFITDGRTIDAPATTKSMNGSVDMSFLVSSAVGALDSVTFCIQSVELSLDNNLTAQNCIGRIGPRDYSEGTAQISISISAYLSDSNWSILAKKISQESFALGFILSNEDGFYGFYLPSIQVSFDDPSSPGQNQDIFLNMSGTAKVGASGENALSIYKS